jgi:hypothetical protein
MNLTRTISRGLVAGAAGTAALNLTTYADMLIRGRPASSVPEKVAGRIAENAGIEPIASSNQEESSGNRRSAAGALMGYVVGLGTGIDYAFLRAMMPGVPVPVAAAGIGLMAMAASDVPATMTDATNPREWTPSSWASDVIPHLIYGFATAAVFNMLGTNDEE